MQRHIREISPHLFYYFIWYLELRFYSSRLRYSSPSPSSSPPPSPEFQNRPATTPSGSSRPGDHRGPKIAVIGALTRLHAPPQSSQIRHFPPRVPTRCRRVLPPTSTAVIASSPSFRICCRCINRSTLVFLGFLPLHGVFFVNNHLLCWCLLV